MENDLFERFALDRKLFPKNLLGSESGDLLIVGGGRCVWEDVNGLPEPTAVMAVNDIGMYWPGQLKHWYSNDDEQLVAWATGRRRDYTYRWPGFRLHSCFNKTGKVHHWPFPGQGSSGLVATFVALALGYEHILVAGIPFDDSGHFFDPPQAHNLRKDRKWSNFTGETPDRLIERSIPLWKGRVRFLSGRLKDL